MKHRHGVSSFARCVGLLLAALALSPSASAQNPPRALVTQAIDESRTVTLRGTVHPLAQARFDQGAVPDSFAANRMLLILNRAPERDAALRQFLADAHTQGTASYHKWLTPEQFGQLYGPADSDVQTATSWLASHGFRVSRVTKGKSLIEFSGTAANVREAFRSEIHQYRVNGETHYANASELAIPEALAPLIRGVSPINDFRLEPALRSIGPATYSRATGKATPLFTLNSGSFFAIAPEDFATQYDLQPLYTAGTNGTGETIGIIGESNLDLSVVNAYRQLFGLSNNPPQIVIDGNDPGIGFGLPDSDLEAYLDVELSGAVAPDATVNLYISDGSELEDPIVLATLRAIEDNQASVLSLSLGECEANLGASGNQLWYVLWQQAAAQGQTAFVSTGDSGSADCDFAGAAAATGGLAVSGVASTPWNVAVGGTDFFYPNYASGTSAATPFWNSANDANNGSLKASLPEQAWDEPFGLNIFPNPIVVGAGGGASSCAIPSNAASGCSGYPKPIWQSAPGVPTDGVRDMPDVSLFAAIGSNMSGYAICAQAGDCVVQNGQVNLVLVGGTSAASPAMAGIMALVNQKFGRQGQADFTLYALARQQPSVFHDITKGTNNVPCQQGTPNCSLDTNGDGLYSLQEYPAGAGYDLATGIGSVDANALVTNWNKASFLASTTTLSLSPTSFTHGTAVNFNVGVAPGSGSGTPTGAVTFNTTSTVPLPVSGGIALTGGAASGTIDFLPGGTYQVTAEYTGDGNFGPSTSKPVNVTVTAEPSAIAFLAEGPTGNVQNSGATAGYGAQWIFAAQPQGLSGTATPAATGTITFSDSDGTTSQKEPITEEGFAGYSPILPLGTNNITISYSGDASYQASTAGPFAFTITQGTPSIFIPTVQPSVPIGGNLLVDVVVGTGFGTPPTGNVSVTLGTNKVMAALAPANYSALPFAVATATFTNIQTAGSLQLSASYAGDTNWTGANTTYGSTIAVAPSARAASSTTLTISPLSVTRFQSTSFSATVSGSGPAPTGTVIFYANGQALPGVLTPTGASSATASAGPISAQSFSEGNNQVIASYSGDTNYNPSASAPGNLTVDLSAFTLALATPRVEIPAGQSGSVPIALNGIGGFSTAVSLACAPSATSFTCGVSPSNPMVSGPTASTLTVNAFTVSNAQTLRPVGNRSPHAPAGLVALLTLLFVLSLLPFARRVPLRWRWASACCLLATLLVMNACGGGSGSSGPPPPPPPQNIPTPAGTYTVLLTATANGVIHNVKLIVAVQ
jgi:Pro-kumamolisin, activation domain/Bacterial Ig-like domain (group 3)/Subtilase family